MPAPSVPTDGMQQMHQSALAMRQIAHGYYTVYRVVQASALFALTLWGNVEAQEYEVAAPYYLTVGYLLWSLLWLVILRGHRMGQTRPMLAGLVTDVIVIVVLSFLPSDAIYGTRVLLVVPIAAGALLLRGRLALFLAAIAASGILFAETLHTLSGALGSGSYTDSAFMGSAYFAVAIIVNFLAGKAARSETLAHERGVDLANLAALNQLVLHRMHTGVLAINTRYQVRFLNPAATHLMDVHESFGTLLGEISPTLYRRLRLWHAGKPTPATPITLAPDSIPILPRFSRVGTDESVTLVFLEDTAMLARHAEAMTLSSLGKLAASIAHEIRNPLGAVSHAAQLLGESTALQGEERRLAEIIETQTDRMDRVVENVLSLARRRSSNARSVDLRDIVNDYIDRFDHAALANSTVNLETQLPDHPATVMADPDHVRQILETLGENARRHGRESDERCHIRIDLARGRQPGTWRLAVCDRGPGVAEKIRNKIFDAFFTTREDGTGLGLFVAKNLCEVNRMRIVYEQRDEWNCFVLRFPAAIDAYQDDGTTNRK